MRKACGYCIEGGVLIPALESAYKGAKPEIDGFYIANYLQEENNLYLAVEEAGKFECRSDFTNIVLCRLYEKYILSWVDNVLYKKNTSIFGHDVLDVFLKKRNELNKKRYVSKIWEVLWNKEIYQDNRQWNILIYDKAGLIEGSLKILNFYYD